MKNTTVSVERLAAYTVVGAGVLLLLRLYLTALILAALPFLFAWVLAYLARPLALRLHKRLHLPLGALSVILVFLALGLAGTGLFFLARRAVLELLALGEQFAAGGEPFGGLFDRVTAWWEGAAARFPFLSALFPREGAFGEAVEGMISEGLGALGEFALHLTGELAAALPGWLLFVLVALVSAFYFALDLGSIHEKLLALLPLRIRERVRQMKESALLAAVGYLRAYLSLMLVTFLVLLVGFLILRVEYALLLAALFALLDFLPIIGIEILLLPWGIFSLAAGNPFLGIGLLVLYAVLMLLRQVLEPRLIGKNLGLHPLLALGATYAGLQLFGFFGMLLLPAVLIVLRGAMQLKTAKPGD